MAGASNQLTRLVARASLFSAAAHQRWHDPEPSEGGCPGPTKRLFLEAIAEAPRHSALRRTLFLAMHAELSTLRGANVGAVERALRRAREARADLDLARKAMNSN
ncbi:MAG: hypothetical protein CMJ28_05680 [Phycisphaerae bacterium]|nr:hypothetical protein [Phycisphaerae bacterium]